MLSRSLRRFARSTLLALTASTAAGALAPALADEVGWQGMGLEGLDWTAPTPLSTRAEVARGLFSWVRRAPFSNPEVVPYFDAGLVPLELHPDRLLAFDTANTLPEKTFAPYVATMQTDPSDSVATGNQVYAFGARYALTDRITLGFDFWNYDDIAISPIAGGSPQIVMEPIEVSGKMRLIERGAFTGAVQLSFGAFTTLQSPIFNGTVSTSDALYGSIKAPFTFDHSPKVQYHITPAISFFPDSVNGADFYGTIFSLGGGVSYRPSKRLALYGALEVPFGSGGNTIATSGAYENTLVWTAGGRYNVTPKVAVDLFLTNGLGLSPATSVLTHMPDGDTVLAGAKLTYTPGASFPDTYRGRPNPLTLRQMRLGQDGLTLGVANTVSPGDIRIGAWYGTDSHLGAQVVWAIDRDFQIEATFEDYANGTLDPALRPTDELRYMVGPKLRFLDQAQGDPVSLAARLLFGRQFDSDPPFIGVFYAEGLASYEFSPKLAVNGAVKLAAFGNTEVLGVGIGANYEVIDGLSLIGEAHLVGADASDATWAFGARYSPPGSTASVDLTATNAIGRQGIGTILAQDEVVVTLGISTQFSLR
ncbi:MAG: hypothetical protein AAF626_11355 [Pseudomonadota bacterium]